MLSQVVQDAINEQINAELSASYSYLAMAAWCEHENWVGAARWLRVQSQEEQTHAMRLFDFLLARHGRIRLTAPATPQADYASLLDVFETALAQEREVGLQINRLYEICFQEKAFDAMVQTEWFITEQVEEEKSAREVAAKLRLVKDDPPSLLEIDRELGARVPEGAPGGRAAN